MSEFWRDPVMDKIIESVIDIFVNIEGVQLVRLKGLTTHLNKIKSISIDEVELLIDRLNSANVIDYKYKLCCPHCKEKSYIIISKEDINVKMCDTCNTFYQLETGKTLFNNITRK